MPLGFNVCTLSPCSLHNHFSWQFILGLEKYHVISLISCPHVKLHCFIVVYLGYSLWFFFVNIFSKLCWNKILSLNMQWYGFLFSSFCTLFWCVLTYFTSTNKVFHCHVDYLDLVWSLFSFVRYLLMGVGHTLPRSGFGVWPISNLVLMRKWWHSCLIIIILVSLIIEWC